MCVGMAGSTLQVGAPLTLLHPEVPQRLLVGTIRAVGAACPGLEHAMVGGPYYLVDLKGKLQLEAALFIAIPGTPVSRPIDRQRLSIRLGPRFPNVQVRSCASSEGVHLTVWAGAPLTSRRLWHAYYYVPFDLEPSCDAREVGDGSGRN